MRYQQQQKGLFTFYKEQELFETQIEVLRNKKKEIELQKLEAEKKAALGLTNSKRNSPEKFKVTSQPAYQEEDAEHQGQISTKIQKFGNSIVVINRKHEEEKDNMKSVREHNYQQKTKQSGHFIQYKNVEFSDLEKHKLSSPLLLQKRKKSYLRRADYSKLEENQRRSTKLPTLMKVEENYAEEEQIPHRAKVNGSSLRYNGGDLMKYIRTNLHSQCQTKHLPEKSVSFFEYSNRYPKEASPKKLQGLNEEQRRLLQILCRFRKDKQR